MYRDLIFYVLVAAGAASSLVRAVRSRDTNAWVGALFFLSLAGGRVIRNAGSHPALSWVVDIVLIVSGFAFAILALRATRRTQPTL